MAKFQYDDTSINDAKIWFASLKKALEPFEIGFDRPLTMSLLKIRPEKVERLEQNTGKETGDQLREKIRKGFEMSRYAMIATDEDGSYEVTLNESGEGLIEWFADNCVKEDTISEQQIAYLYDMAKQGRLMMNTTDREPDNYLKTRLIMVSEENTVKISGPFSELESEIGNGIVTEEIYNSVNRYFKDMMENNRSALQNSKEDLGMIPDRTKEERKEDRLLINHCFEEEAGFRLIARMAQLVPELYDTDEKLKKQSELYELTMLSGFYENEEQEKTASETFYMDSVLPFVKSLLKKTGKKSLEEIMKNNLVRDADGNGYASGDLSTYLYRIRRDSEEKGIVIGGEKYFNGQFGLQKGISLKEYEDASDYLRDSIYDATDNLETADMPSALYHFVVEVLPVWDDHLRRDIDALDENYRGVAPRPKVIQSLFEVCSEANAFISSVKRKELKGDYVTPEEKKCVLLANKIIQMDTSLKNGAAKPVFEQWARCREAREIAMEEAGLSYNSFVANIQDYLKENQEAAKNTLRKQIAKIMVCKIAEDRQIEKMTDHYDELEQLSKPGVYDRMAEQLVGRPEFERAFDKILTMKNVKMLQKPGYLIDDEGTLKHSEILDELTEALAQENKGKSMENWFREQKNEAEVVK